MKRKAIPLWLILGCLLTAGLSGGLPSRYHDFAQVGDGGGFRTTFLLLNQNPEPADVTLEFFRDDGTPWTVSLDGVSRSVAQFQISPRGMLRLSTDNLGSQPQSGWAALRSSQELGAQVFFEIFSGERLVTQAAVESSGPIRVADLFVENRSRTKTGIAIVNLAEPGANRPVRVDMTLRNPDGSVERTATLILQAGEHLARFADDLFDDGISGELGDFRGTLSLRASGPVSLMTLQQSGLVLGTLPVVQRTF